MEAGSLHPPRPEGRVRTYVLERKPFADALGRGEGRCAGRVPGRAVAFADSAERSVSLDDWATLSERIKIWPDALLIEAEGCGRPVVVRADKLLKGAGAAGFPVVIWPVLRRRQPVLRENLPPHAVLDLGDACRR